MKYLVFSDAHLHPWSEFATPDPKYLTSRLKLQIQAITDVLEQARKDKATVLFLGDLFHQRGSVKTQVFNLAYNLFAEYTDVPVIMIEGNHDNVTNSIHSASTLEPFTHLPNVTLIPEYDSFTVPNTQDTITAVSYGDEYAHLKEFIKSNPATILMAHLGVEGAMGAGNSKLEGAFTVSDLYPDTFGVVLLGHYHKSQYLAPNTLYVGNPVAQNFGDANMHKGYYSFETKDGNLDLSTLVFHDLHYPEFLAYEASELPENVDELIETNYVRVRGEGAIIDKAMKLDTEAPIKNIKIEKTFSANKDTTRIGIKGDSTPIDITKKWADEFQPDNTDTLVNIVTRAINE